MSTWQCVGERYLCLVLGVVRCCRLNTSGCCEENSERSFFSICHCSRRALLTTPAIDLRKHSGKCYHSLRSHSVSAGGRHIFLHILTRGTPKLCFSRLCPCLLCPCTLPHAVDSTPRPSAAVEGLGLLSESQLLPPPGSYHAMLWPIWFLPLMGF